MPEHYLSRVHLRRDAAVAAIARPLVSEDSDARTSAAHGLIWSLFAGDRAPISPRLLWREEASKW